MRHSIVILLLNSTLILECSEKNNGNDVQKIFHHIKNDEDKTITLELGVLSLYFVKNPTITRIPSTRDEYYEFFIKDAQLTDESKQMLAKLPQSMKYHIAIKEMQKPKGIMVHISDKKGMLEIVYAVVDAITQQSCATFRFYDKQYLDTLRRKHVPLLRTASNHTPTVVIDCGHGGNDHGSICNGIQEKMINLSVGTKLASLLQQEGFRVFLTRNNDDEYALDQRTCFANKVHGDIFVSIHANYAPNHMASGIETFYIKSMPLVFDTRNHHMKKKITQYVHTHEQASKQLADTIHYYTINAARTFDKNIKDRTVKQAISQVLLGTAMPSVLIEVGFLSNVVEAARLLRADYQELLARGISKGIMAYFSVLS